MATIRAYTTIEQSRKLAEILPLESADMHYVLIDTDEDKYAAGLGKYIGVLPHYPCWSLASLLDIIKKCGLIDLRFLSSTFDGRGNHLTNVWCCTFEDIGTVILNLYADNPIDACYNMTIRLNELKKL